jgi:hypothetical protein
MGGSFHSSVARTCVVAAHNRPKDRNKKVMKVARGSVCPILLWESQIVISKSLYHADPSITAWAIFIRPLRGLTARCDARLQEDAQRRVIAFRGSAAAHCGKPPAFRR